MDNPTRCPNCKSSEVVKLADGLFTCRACGGFVPSSVPPVSITKINNYETKEIECDKCGRVSKVAKHIPLRFAKCPECGSLRIRLYKIAKGKRQS